MLLSLSTMPPNPQSSGVQRYKSSLWMKRKKWNFLPKTHPTLLSHLASSSPTLCTVTFSADPCQSQVPLDSPRLSLHLLPTSRNLTPHCWLHSRGEKLNKHSTQMEIETSPPIIQHFFDHLASAFSLGFWYNHGLFLLSCASNIPTGPVLPLNILPGTLHSLSY